MTYQPLALTMQQGQFPWPGIPMDLPIGQAIPRRSRNQAPIGWYHRTTFHPGRTGLPEPTNYGVPFFIGSTPTGQPQYQYYQHHNINQFVRGVPPPAPLYNPSFMRESITKSGLSPLASNFIPQRDRSQENSARAVVQPKNKNTGYARIIDPLPSRPVAPRVSEVPSHDDALSQSTVGPVKAKVNTNPNSQPPTHFLLHKAYSSKASYLEVHEWYAKRLQTDNDTTIKGAFKKDIKAMLSAEGIKEEKFLWFKELKRERGRYQGRNTKALNKAVKLARTENERYWHKNKQGFYKLILKAEHATQFEFENLYPSLEILEESGRWKGNPEKEQLMKEVREEVDMLERRLEFLIGCRKMMNEEKREEKEGIKQRLLMQPDGSLGDIEGSGTNRDRELGFDAEEAEREIEAAMNGIGAIALGYVKRDEDGSGIGEYEDDDEGDVEEGEGDAW
ncbi:hypothetical protein ABW19_dt0204141 [Dactylella cylindrospora]|nr:hypothetical protein ABW19_dt0204141 [Dactylella cylindrospora]